MNERIENIKKSLPEDKPFLAAMLINDLQINGKITQEEANELLDWIFGWKVFTA